ncbi:MAG: hypothetical protein CM15mP120_01560 [Pseudomonadota bacterium]|nr:MAG: hypothetical protein CM15mP120_01560 [Pseudomonadota bacterium]
MLGKHLFRCRRAKIPTLCSKEDHDDSNAVAEFRRELRDWLAEIAHQACATVPNPPLKPRRGAVLRSSGFRQPTGAQSAWHNAASRDPPGR